MKNDRVHTLDRLIDCRHAFRYFSSLLAMEINRFGAQARHTST